MNEVKFKANIKDLKAVQAEVEAIPVIPDPTVANAGKVPTVIVDSSGETPVAQYELADPLPAIASGDAGKVLTVNAGETGAEWAAASGGGGDYVIGSTEDPSTGVLTLDKTGLEIVTALLNNSSCYIIGHTGDTSTGVYLSMPIYHSQWGNTGAVFYAWSFVHNRDISFSCAELSEYPHTAT